MSTLPIEKPKNEMDHILSYSTGTRERAELMLELEKVKNTTEDIPLIIGGKEVRTNNIYEVTCPHDHRRILAHAHLATDKDLRNAIDSAAHAQKEWAAMDPYHRASIFLKAADLLTGPRRIQNIAAIMANLSKTPFEAEIDLIELIDFWRFNAYYMRFLYEQQPDQSPGEKNRFDWRPLEGFVLAVSPFNFYSIGGNLPTAPAMVGNVALWKPSRSVILANYRIMQVLIEAGLPAGVINFVPFDGKFTDTVLGHPALAGLHFTGSYDTLVALWQNIGRRLPEYANFPRVVGESGGKDFIVVHPSADIGSVVTNAVRGAFESQGQKCSAASRMYVPASLWKEIEKRLRDETAKIKVGPVEDLSVYVGALITEEAYHKVVSYIELAKSQPQTYEIIYGGGHDSSKGWFVNPTIILSKDPKSRLMAEEVFGPVLTVYVYPDADYEKTLELCNSSTLYALTGSVFATDRQAIVTAERVLRFAAGNFYINDKPTGAIVGRQPFGGARRSGTNDKAGFWLNVARWMSPRNIKETLVPAQSWQRPYMG